MGVAGVELRWKPGSDDGWLSHYTVSRDGELIDRVSKGCFYFDHSAGADPGARYEVRAVDGAGNESHAAAVDGRGLRRRVHNDDDAAIEYSGEWHRETGFAPAHKGTLSFSESEGASLTLRFSGRQVRWHSRLGAAGGLARVALDDEDPVVLSGYAADEIPQWPLFEREWERPGEHVLRIEVLGQSDPRTQGTRVWVDAFSVLP